jgi:hypothetical protein
MTRTTRIEDKLLGGHATVELIWSEYQEAGMVYSTDATGEQLYREDSSSLKELEDWYRREITAVTKAVKW